MADLRVQSQTSRDRSERSEDELRMGIATDQLLVVCNSVSIICGLTANDTELDGFVS